MSARAQAIINLPSLRKMLMEDVAWVSDPCPKQACISIAGQVQSSRGRLWQESATLQFKRHQLHFTSVLNKSGLFLDKMNGIVFNKRKYNTIPLVIHIDRSDFIGMSHVVGKHFLHKLIISSL